VDEPAEVESPVSQEQEGNGLKVQDEVETR
jgi:hypothetical protein